MRAVLFVVLLGCRSSDLILPNDMGDDVAPQSTDFAVSRDFAHAIDFAGDARFPADAASLCVPTAASGRVIFEVEYENYAWGYQCSGRVVDDEGNVHSYSYDGSGEQCPHHDDDLFDETELGQKYAHKKQFLCAVDVGAMQSEWSVATAASTGTLSSPQSRCADFGDVTYSAYLFDHALGKYKRVTIKQRGDNWRDNTHACSSALVAWFDSSCLGTHPGDPCL